MIIKKHTFPFLLFAAFLIYSSASPAFTNVWRGVSISYGAGKPDNLKGGRISYQFLPQASSWKSISIYYDSSLAYWHVDYQKHKSLAVVAIAPVVRFHPYNGKYFVPYLEGSIGAALLSRNKLGHRDLGAILAFQDILGGGFQFGSKQQFDLNFRYLHYSNAGFAPPNNGIDVKTLITFAYHF
jgi:lipid A 3-O-deacylase